MQYFPFPYNSGKRFLLLMVLGTASSWTLCAAPPYHPRQVANTNSSFRDVIDDLQQEVGNHESEILMFEERLITQENILDSLRQQLLDTNQSNQDLVKGNTASFESRIAAMESALSGVVNDIRKLQEHSNESAKVLSQYKKKIMDLDEQIDHFQVAINSIFSALQLDTGNSTAQVYEVQSGDSLEKIARKHKTTIKKLKELNGLKNDRIYIGQKIKLPNRDI
ncbi:MAG: putative peptidoglycan endopeptidase LytE [Chlamydiae bacterium]|nr:putative peptidoglycan endopeptidase LytE [Chlamydiota bacterium]